MKHRDCKKGEKSPSGRKRLPGMSPCSRLPVRGFTVRNRFWPTVSAVLATSLFWGQPVLAQLAATALPSGGRVSAGSAAISQSGAANLTVNQSSARAVIDWTSFNIGRESSVHFAQPSSSAIALNRVGADGGRSLIEGRLSSTGQVWLLNPGGVLFGPSSRIDVGGLLTSTMQLSNERFLNGDYRLDKDGSGSIINQGRITAADRGYVALLAPEVINEGVISARLGTVALAGGEELRLDFTGDRLIEVRVDRATIDGFIANRQLIEADGGLVIMSTDAASRLHDGAINNSGIIRAQSIDEEEGRIIILGGATTVGGTLDASAPNSGDGGFIETSGHTVNTLTDLRVTTSAPYGKTGTWLIDPIDYYVAATGGNITGAALGGNLASSNVTINTTGTGGNGDIFVNDGVNWSSGNTLTLSADRHVEINAQINATNGGLTVTAGNNISVTRFVYTGGAMSLTAGGNLNLTAGTSGNGNYATLAAAGNQQISANQIVLTGGGSGPSDYYNSAAIVHKACKSELNGNCIVAGDGNQAINLTGSSALLQLTGGAGSGSAPGSGDQGCTLGTDCYQSGNGAYIGNYLGNQTIHFNETGGNISLTGGTNGVGNEAEIYNNQSEYWNGSVLSSYGPLPGEQKIYGSPNISLTGGKSGGRLLYYGAKTHDSANDAGIYNEGASQVIIANDLTILGSPSDASTNAVSGAWLASENSGNGSAYNITQNVTVGGTLSITGGKSILVPTVNDSSKSGHTSGAGIILANEQTGGNGTSTINVTGNLSMVGGASAYSPAIIGGVGSNISFDINVSGNASLASNPNDSAALLGTFPANTYIDWSTYANRIMIGSPIDLQANGNLNATTPGTLYNAGILSGNNITLKANNMELSGSSTATNILQISTYDTAYDIRIETSPTAGKLSLSPSELDTLHLSGSSTASSEIIIGDSNTGNLTVSNTVSSDQINGNFYFQGSSLTIDAQISAGSGVGRLGFITGGSSATFNSPVSASNEINLISSSGSFSQGGSGTITAGSLKAHNTGSSTVDLDDATNSIGKVAVNVGGAFWLKNAGNLEVASINSRGLTTNGITASHVGVTTTGTLTMNAPITATSNTGPWYDYYQTTWQDPLCASGCARPNIELRGGTGFVNNVGSGALTLPNNTYWAIVSDHPGVTTLNGLTPGATSYNAAEINGLILLGANRLFYQRQTPTTTTTTSSAVTSTENSVSQETTNQEDSSQTASQSESTIAPDGGFGGGGASLSQFPASATPITNQDSPPPPPKLVVDASRAVPRRAGVLNRDDLLLLAQRVRENRVQLFADALNQLANDPNAADVPECGNGGSDTCIAGKPVLGHGNLIPEVKKKVALLIGNNEYRSPIPSLETPLNDVKAIAAQLREKLGYEVRVVENADRHGIINALNGLINELGQDDSVMIMYAGHGYLDEKSGKGYWIPTDASTTAPDKWISNESITRALANLPAKQVLLVSDSCYSGSLTKEGKVTEMIGSTRDQTLTRRSVLALSSGGEEPVSDEGYENHSIFAWNLIQTMKGLPSEITGQQLHVRLREAVSKDFPQDPQYGVVLSAGHSQGGEYLLIPKKN